MFEGMTPADSALLKAIVVLAHRADATIGEPFKVTRAALIVESGLKPLTVDCSLYRLDRDGFVTKDGRRGAGTWLTVRALPRYVPEAA